MAKEITLQSQIPENFFKLFASKYRDTFIDYIIAIYDDMSHATRLRSGRTKAECRDVINAMPVSEASDVDGEELPDIEYDVYDNRFFACLVKWGWLSSKYDSDCGENLYVVPEYARLFVEVFKALKKSQIETSAAISTVYANIVTFRLREKDRRFLIRAHEELLRLNSSLSVSSETFEKKTSSLLQLDNSIELLENWLQSYNEIWMSSTEQGSFRYFYGKTNNDIRELMTEAEDGLASRDAPAAEDDDQNDGYILIDMLNDIYHELRRTGKLFEDNLEKSRKMCLRAIEKAKYLQARDEQAGVSTLLTLIGAFAKEKEEEGTACINRSMKAWGSSPGTRSVFSARIPISRNKEADPDKVLLMDENASGNIQAEPDRYRTKYTAKELKEFEQSRTEKGKFTADESTIKSQEDLDRYIYLLFRTMGTSRSGGTIKYAASDDEDGYVRLGNGLGFTKTTWEVET